MHGRRVRAWGWWVGVPIVVALATWLPFVSFNGFIQPEDGWRIRIVPQSMYDTYTYLYWLGKAVWGEPQPLGWIAAALQVIARVLPASATLVEIWLFSRFLFVTLALWLFVPLLRLWTGLERTHARVLTVGFALGALLVLSLRPGAYSWDLPFLFASLLFLAFSFRALRAGRRLPAVGWSIAALVAASVYPWAALFVGMVLATVWSLHLARHARKFWWGALAFSSFISALLALPVARWALEPSQAGLLDFFERSGLAFARLPQVTQILVLSVFWLVAFLWLSRDEKKEESSRILRDLALLWAVLVATWLHTPFTGVYTHNDHFRLMTLLLAWISLGAFWSVVRRWEPLPGKMRIRFLGGAMGGLGAAAIIYIIFSSTRGPVPAVDALNLFHLAAWLPLLLAGALLLLAGRPLGARALGALVLPPAAVLGAIGLFSLFQLERPRAPLLQDLRPLVTDVAWEGGRVCTDPSSADILAAHTGRDVFPAEFLLWERVPQESILREFDVYAGAYDIRRGGQEDAMRARVRAFRGMPCDQYPFLVRWVRATGVGSATVDRVTGCREDAILRDQERLSDAMEKRLFEEAAFKELCPRVLLRKTERALWRLPSSYVERSVTDLFSLWDLP